MGSDNWEQRCRQDVRVSVSAVDYADYQKARLQARGGGHGHWAREALRLHLQLFYPPQQLTERDQPRIVLHPLLQGMR